MEAGRCDCGDLGGHIQLTVDIASQVSCLCAGGVSGSEIFWPPGGIRWRGIFENHYFGLVCVQLEAVGLYPGGHFGLGRLKLFLVLGVLSKRDNISCVSST